MLLQNTQDTKRISYLIESKMSKESAALGAQWSAGRMEGRALEVLG